MTAIALLLLLRSACAAAPADPGWIWVEGERPARTDIAFAHPWYAGEVKKGELSGGEFIANFGPRVGNAEYEVEIPSSGTWAFWVRANPVMRECAWRLDGRAWTTLDMNRNKRGELNIAADGGVDLRYIAWAKAGDLALAKGTHRIELSFRDGSEHHGSLDCFVLARAPFEPQGKLKPGERSGLADPGTWAFEPAPDRFADDALLDLRGLNEPVAGQSGFVRRSDSGDDFVLGDGRPVRFWAVNTTVFRSADLAGVERHARFLAKRGVNMVRAHVQVSVSTDGSRIADTDARTIDDIRKLVAGMKRAGIYTTISPYWAAAQRRVPASWGVDAPADRDAQGLLFFDGDLQSGYREWLRALYAPVNPYTGIPLAKDPAVAVIQLQNEDSLLFWTAGNLKGAPLRRLGVMYGRFLKGKYGSTEAAVRVWGTGAGLKEDDPGHGYVHIQHPWELTQDRPGAMGKRLADQVEFLATTMRGFNATAAKFLRDELGCRQLVNAGNWRTADQTRLLDAERWSYLTNEVVAVNRYWGPVHVNPGHPDRAGYTVEAGDFFTDPSACLDPRELPVNAREVCGYPFIVTESTWTAPGSHGAEAPFLVAAYGSLGGLDGFYWFATGSPEWALPGEKFGVSDPAILGGFPAAALAYRRGDIRQGEVLHEERPLADLWDRKPPVLAEDPGFDPNRDPGDRPVLAGAQAGDPLAYLAGRVEAVYGGDPAETRMADLAGLIDRRANRVRSVTGELDLNWGQGIATLNAPRVQGAAGFLAKRRTFDLADVRIESGNPYAVVLAVSLDGEPLAVSRKVLVQTTTVARAHGFRTEPASFKGSDGKVTYEGYRILALGGPPWNVANTDFKITIRNPKLKAAVLLDPNGEAVRDLPATAARGALTVVLPPDALYTILR